MRKPYLSVIIPAYNEAKRLPLTLIDIDKHLSGVKFPYEILVVNDGSTDKTAEIARKFSEILPNIRIIDNQVNRGKGAVVREGMLKARGDFRLFTDADNSTSITHFEKMIPFFKQGYDVVIGSRDVKGARLEPPQTFSKRLAGNMGNLLIQAMLLPGLWDTQCGFKCFKEKAALKVFPLQKIFGWSFDVEILALAKSLGFKIKEIPVTWINDPISHVKAWSYFQVLGEVFRIRFWLWSDSYGLKSGKILEAVKTPPKRLKSKNDLLSNRRKVSRIKSRP